MLRRSIILAVSLLVYGFDRLRRALLRLGGKSPRATCVVLLYHEIAAAEGEAFQRQMKLACRIASPVRAHPPEAIENGRRYFAVTFDDGLKSFAERALPVLTAMRIPALLFVVSGGNGRIPGWAADPGNPIATERMLSDEELQALPPEVAIGSHTITHPVLPRLAAGQAAREIVESRQQLQRISGQPVETLSFPYGEFTEQTVMQCRAAGYTRVFSILPVLAFIHADEYVTGRVNASPSDTNIEFRLKLCGACRWLPQAFRAKRLLRRLGSPISFERAHL